MSRKCHQLFFLFLFSPDELLEIDFPDGSLGANLNFTFRIIRNPFPIRRGIESILPVGIIGGQLHDFVCFFRNQKYPA